ncbi:fibronectin type III domain-containing protein [Microbacterium sp. PA5]|uniref:fibronectin type III domain-containing protein n=1 Tax=Microbacterium sp. PA5 TaxID=3416654 RepID=UPI003CF056E9
MRLLSPRGAVAVLAAAALVVATPVASASAASRPAPVGLVSFVSASLTSSGATLTVDWADVSGARKYEVFAATTYEGVADKRTPSLTVTSSKATLTRLTPGRDYFVQVRAVNSVGFGGRSARVGHGTILTEAKLTSDSPRYRAISWNICSNACSSISTRARVINTRVKELKADILGFQEASRYTKAPVGFRHVVNGQNDILVRTGQFSLVAKKTSAPTSGTARFASKYATSGKGLAYAALKHRSGSYVLVFDVHLVTGTSRAQVNQREYEASRLNTYISATMNRLAKTHGSLTDWTKAHVLILGDFNTHKSRTGEDTMAILEKRGWYDTFDQAHALTRQHHNTANPEWSTKPTIGVTWGAHVDKALVRPSRSVVYRWANAGEMVNGRYVTPLGSDHHPLLVDVGLR